MMYGQRKVLVALKRIRGSYRVALEVIVPSVLFEARIGWLLR